jgi:hypothetical protein
VPSFSERIASLVDDVRGITAKLAARARWQEWFEEQPDTFSVKPDKKGEGGTTTGTYTVARMEKLFGANPSAKDVAGMAKDPRGSRSGPGRSFTEAATATKRGPRWHIEQRWGLDV